MAGHILTSKDITTIAAKLYPKTLKIVAIIYMGLEHQTLEQLDEQNRDKEAFKRDVITRWSYKGHNKQELANILQNSRILRRDEILPILGPYEYTVIYFPKPSNEPRIKHSELGRLSEKITLPNMKGLATGDLELSDVQVDDIENANPGEPWGIKFDILVKWYNQSGGTRQSLIEILKKSEKIKPHLIQEILGDGGSPTAARTGTGATGVSFPGTSSEAGHSSQVLDPNETSAGERHKQTASVKPITDSGPKFIQADLTAILTKIGQKGQLPSATFSSGFSFQPLNDLSKVKTYDWLKFNEILEVTKDMAKTTNPVVVAILDTGIYELHPDLKEHMLGTETRWFVPAKDNAAATDTWKDQNNHGTIVAGIIVRNGPENIKIVNLKVLPEPGKETNIGAMIDALNYVKNLKIKVDGREHRVHIVNMSVGQFLLPEGLDPILRELAGDMVLIASAGNLGATSPNAVTYPGKHPNVICVGSYDEKGCETNESSKGEEVAILCPGKDVFSTYNSDGGFLYGLGTGSSFAAPHAVAAAAHVLVAMEYKKDLEYRKRLCNSLVMKFVLKRMCRGNAVLRPYEECFKHFYLDGYCDDALGGR